MNPAKMTARPDPTRNLRQLAHTAAQKARGLVLVRVWVPADRVADLRNVAKEMTK